MKRYFAAAFMAASALAPLASQAACHSAPYAARVRPTRTTLPDDMSAPNPPSAAPLEAGVASFYGPSFHGRRAADGRRFNQWDLTAAHAWLPFGTRIRVTLAGSRRSVVVTITDRFHSSRRVLDLSVAAARSLGILSRGVAEVQLTRV